MKRRQLIKHIEAYGCVLLREGGGHSIYVNPKTMKQTAVPRHVEVADILARKICRQLEIPIIGKDNP